MESPGSSQRAVTPIGAHIRNLQQQEEQQRSRDSEQANCHIKLDTVGPPGQRTRSIACTAFFHSISIARHRSTQSPCRGSERAQALRHHLPRENALPAGSAHLS